MTDFYITLPSNAHASLPTNRANNYVVILPEAFQSMDDYDVALTNFSFTHSWDTLGTNEDNYYDVSFTNYDYGVRFPIPRGSYVTVFDLINTLNNCLRSAVGTVNEPFLSPRRVKRDEDEPTLENTELDEEEEPTMENTDLDEVVQPEQPPLPISFGQTTIDDENNIEAPPLPIALALTYDKFEVPRGSAYKSFREFYLKEIEPNIYKYFQFRYDEVKQRIVFESDATIVRSVQVSPQIAYICGFSTPLLSGVTVASDPFDIRGGLSTLYVYCDIIVPQIVGGSRAHLLRDVHVNAKPGTVVQETFIDPHYLPILYKDINAIRIEVRGESGRLVPFRYGTVSAKLHFRKHRFNF